MKNKKPSLVQSLKRIKIDKDLEPTRIKHYTLIDNKLRFLQILWSYKSKIKEVIDSEVEDHYEASEKIKNHYIDFDLVISKLFPELKRLLPNDDIWIDEFRDDGIGVLLGCKTLKQFVNTYMVRCYGRW